MPHLIVTGDAQKGLSRCGNYLTERDLRAAERAGEVIRTKLDLLKVNPAIGRRVSGSVDLRELVIGFGRSGYIALYRHVPDRDTVYVLAFRHQREARY